MKAVAALVLAAALGCTSAAARDARTERMIAAALVKIYVTANPPDYQSPWQRVGVLSATGSGVIVAGNRVLTAAHVVADAVAVEVKRTGGTRRFRASVLHVGHACDLAVLQVEDPAFFDGSRALAFGGLPRLRDRVDVFGFPEGGERIAVTSGIVSRVETGAYAHSGVTLLQVQIDAAINAGNSGGPVVAGPRIVGIATETLAAAENIGYMIPVPVIQHFLDDVADGTFDGFPALGIELQPLDNPEHRRALGLDGTDAGVLVTRVNFGSPAWSVLEPGDVLTHVDSVEVSRDGTVQLRADDRVEFSHLISSKQVGTHAQLRVRRNGGIARVSAELDSFEPLVPGPRYDVMPTYLLFGGLVFQPLTSDYLDLFGGWPPDLASYALSHNVVREDRRQVVVLTHVLSHPMNQGYEELEDFVVERVDGDRVRDMHHLAALLAGDSGWVDIQLQANYRIGMDRGSERAARAEIMSNYGIPADRSSDLAAP
jgi:S1-C subfamily serine protease